VQCQVSGDCCSGMSENGICAQRPTGAYCEEQTASLCESLTCGSRVCGDFAGGATGEETGATGTGEAQNGGIPADDGGG
jgi:hypothetical protein